jgi:hypothetical protein
MSNKMCTVGLTSGLEVKATGVVGFSTPSVCITDRIPIAVMNFLVFSLQSSQRESLEYVNLLQTVDHLAARKDQLREPVEGNEVLHVIQRRLLARTPSPEEAAPAATAYQDIVTQMKRGYAKGKAEERQAEPGAPVISVSRRDALLSGSVAIRSFGPVFRGRVEANWDSHHAP